MGTRGLAGVLATFSTGLWRWLHNSVNLLKIIIIHLKWIHFMIHKLYLNKVSFLKIETRLHNLSEATGC